MGKSATRKSWLNEVEAFEERLEAMKAASGPFSGPMVLRPTSVVQSTLGLLGHRVAPGTVYEKQTRRSWERSSRRRVA